MTINAIETKLKHHLNLLELDPRLASQLTSLVLKWNREGGATQAVERLKQVKLSLVHFWAGEADYLKHAPWFKRSKDRKGLYGPFRHLFRKNASKTFLRRALSIVNSYTVFIDSDKTALGKARDSVKFISDSYRGDSISLPVGFNIGIKIHSPEERIKPNLAGLWTSKPGGYQVSSSKWLDSLMSTAYHRLPYETHLDTTGIKPAISESATEFDHVAGRLQFLREKGMKVRTICLPHSEYQVALLPLHQSLAKALRGVKEDCTFDQDEGALWAQNKLARGYTCHSIDLKSATDRFPRKLQLLFARCGGLSENWINAFESIVSLPHDTGDGEVTYAVGQPMGYYGSFPLLALGQHGLVRLAAYNLKISYRDQYRVLGDDVIIANDALSAEYYRLLQQFDIPISWHKCVSSNKVAEFAGYLIREDGIHKGVKPSLAPDSLSTFVNYCKVMNKIPRALEHLHVLVPLAYGLVEHGGLGLNPKGLTKEERSFWFDPVRGTDLDQDQKRFQKWNSYRRLVNEMIYSEAGDHCEVGALLENYVVEVENTLESRAQTLDPSLSPVPGIMDHFSGLSTSFLLGVTPYNTEIPPITTRWVKKKFPYYFMDQENF